MTEPLVSPKGIKHFGMIDAAGNMFIIKGYYLGKFDDPKFILPKEVLDRMSVIYNITDEVIAKCRWASSTSPDAINIFRGMFNAVSLPTHDLKAYYDGTQYGSRTHRSF